MKKNLIIFFLKNFFWKLNFKIFFIVFFLCFSFFNIWFWQNLKDNLLKPIEDKNQSLFEADKTNNSANSWSTLRDDVSILENWATYIISKARIFLWIALVIFLFITLIRLLFSWWDEALWALKNQFLYWAIWLIWIFAVDPFIRIIWWWTNSLEPWKILFSKDWFNMIIKEIWWIMWYIRTFVALIAVVLLIKTWFEIYTGWGEDQSDKFKKTILSVWTWIVLIFLWEFLIYWIYWDPTKWTWPDIELMSKQFFGFVKYLMYFLSFFAVIMIIYAWILMILPFWEDETKQKWKNIIIWILSWVILILLSYAIVSTIMILLN